MFLILLFVYVSDVPLSLHFESLLKTGDWQHKPAPKPFKPLTSSRRNRFQAAATKPDYVPRKYTRRAPLSKSASAAMLSASKYIIHG